MIIHQILAGLGDGDAISHEALLLQQILRQAGHASELFVDSRNVSPGLRAQCRPLESYRGAATDLCLHHYGITSPAADIFLASPARKILVYHNITPAEYFTGFDDAIAARLAQARTLLPDIARRADAVWADSRFNARELQAAGIADVRVLELPFEPAALDLPPDPRVVRQFSGPTQNILFVGRIAPNKRVEDLIQAFAWYNRAINPFSRLIIVGSNRSAPRYYTMLRMLAGEMDLVNVCFVGFASAAGLAACYCAAQVYVCSSVHEGYCLPLIEAIHMGVPVIARAAGAMPETLAGAGVLYDDLQPEELAELIHRVLSDPALRQDILASQQARLQRLQARNIEQELHALLAEVMPWKNQS